MGRRARGLLAAIAAVGVLAVGAPAWARVQAVFVGVDRYANSHTHRKDADPGFHDLEDSVADVALLKGALKSRLNAVFDPGPNPPPAIVNHYARVAPGCEWTNATSTTLADHCATRAKILKSLRARVTTAGRGDLILFFFSGLGSSLPAPNGTREGVLVPADGRGPDGRAPDIRFSELAALQARAKNRGARLFSILEAAAPTTGSCADGNIRAAPPAKHAPSAAKGPIDLDAIVLACESQVTDVPPAVLAEVGRQQGVLTQALLERLKGGVAPWKIKPPTPLKGVTFLRQPVFSRRPGSKTIVYNQTVSALGVTGGNPAKPGEAPWIVELHAVGPIKAGVPDTPANRHVCDGALIADHWAITAAHCLQEHADQPINPDWAPLNFTVRTGSSDLDARMTEFAITKVFPHPDYCAPEMDARRCPVYSNDIALLYLTEKTSPAAAAPSEPPPDLKTIQVAGLDATVRPGDPVELYGWGAVSARNSAAHRMETRLMEATLNVIAPDDCRGRLERAVRAESPSDHAYAADLPDTILCAGSPGNVQDACQGDSGGPVVDYSLGVEPELVGVVSSGFSCAAAPGLYTAAAKYRGWMNMVIQTTERDRGS